MPDTTTTKLEVRIKELETEVKGLRTENQKLLDEVEGLKDELEAPIEVEYPEEHKTLVRDLAATYVCVKSDGRIDSRERDELDAKLDELLAKLNVLIGG